MIIELKINHSDREKLKLDHEIFSVATRNELTTLYVKLIQTLSETRFEVLIILMHEDNTCQPRIQQTKIMRYDPALTFQNGSIHDYSNQPQTFYLHLLE